MIFKFLIAVLVALMSFNVRAGELKQLPLPDKTTPLMKVIDKRVSGRAYSSEDIGLQTLSDLLWSAFGINEKGTRTIPTARNEQNLKVYVVYQNSVWAYRAEQKFSLIQIQFPYDTSVSQFSHSVMSDSLLPHGLQHARLPFPSPTLGAYSNSCPLSR